MDLIEQAGQEVLLSYGQFLEGLNTHCYSIKNKLKSGSFKCFEDSFGVQIEYPDHSPIPEKVDAQDKILIVFAAICKEIRELEKELMLNYAPLISDYGEACPDKSDRLKALSSICKFLPTLQDVSNFVHRCRQTLNHLLQQLLCYYNFQKTTQIVSSAQFVAVFSSLSSLLKIFVVLDVLFEGNNDNPIKEHLILLEKVVNTSEVEFSGLKDGPLMSVISDVLFNILSLNIFGASLQMHMENRSLGNCVDFKNHLNYFFKNRISLVETKDTDMDSLVILSNVIITYVFAVNVFGISDKKVHRSIRDLSKKCTVSTLCDGVMWIPSNFLLKHLELKLRENVSNLNVNQQTLCRCLEVAEINLLKDIKMYTFKVYRWSLQMSNVLSADAMYIKLNDMDSANLCFEGLELSKQMKLAMNTITYLHSSLAKPMAKVVAVSLCKMTELIKAVKSIFQRHHLDIGKRINHIIQRFLIQSLTMVIKVKKGIIKDEGCKDVQIDDYSSLELIEKLLYGACIEDNMLLIQLAVALISPENSLGGESNIMLGKLLSNLHTISSLKTQLEEATNCNLVFKEPHLLPIYFKHVMDSGLSLFRFQLILHSLPNCSIKQSFKEDSILKFSKESFETMVVPELCHRIETYLRLHAHSHLQDGESLPLDQNDFREHLRVPTLTMANHYVNIHSLVEDYLDKIFYDLATVALHDWQTYREMRSLAEYELKLYTVEDYLPSQTLSQGLDILEIMRNIHIFVSRYLYNLNNQCFVESGSNNKHLNTIKINQLANSIWTHGTGVMNTTTNFVYQYLKKKIVQFSQFLFDEKISSRLLKDKAHFNLLKNQHQPLFPYDRASKFNKSINRLGTSEGLNYLDQCRILITQIGNALGYIRMVRTGGLHHCLEASSYLPQISYVYSSKENMRETGCDAIDCLVQFVCSLNHNLTEGSEYLKILTEVFSNIFDTPENNHLRLFPIILPSLTINYIEHIVTEKEKVSKKNKNGMIFSDDGFAIGVTYLLSVLNLHDEFESLHWFDSVNKMYDEEEQLIESQLAGEPNDMKSGDNTLKLSIRRLKLYKKEFELLYYNLNSAKIFFH
uniref:WASH complex subunit 7 n=1 Tax=Lygus hesperus TaxID=30085 RepID=A0A146KS95_LYGHE